MDIKREKKDIDGHIFKKDIILLKTGADSMRATDTRAIELGEYIVESGATVRATAKIFKISKSTVHKDVTERLRREDPVLYGQVKEVLEKNKQDRHIRGGMATREKYKKLK